jgi:YD repeat-containing protein
MKTMTDRERYGLRGPVKSCQVHRVWYSCGGTDSCDRQERSDTSITEFHSNGSLQRQIHTNPDGSMWTSLYEYDGRGLLVLMKSDSARDETWTRRYEYDSQERIVRLTTRSNGRDHVAETYTYSDAGRKTKTIHVDEQAQRTDTTHFYGIEGTDTNYSAPGTFTVTTIYNEHANALQLLFHDKDARRLSHVDFDYDEAGNLIEEAQFRDGDMLPAELLAGLNPAQLETGRALFGGAGEPFTRLRHHYDEHGRRIESTNQFTAMNVDRRLLTYNEHGDPSQEVFEQEHADFQVDDAGRIPDTTSNQRASRSEARFRYQYDDGGNWMEKIVDARSRADQDFLVSSTERRIITYFAPGSDDDKPL